MHLRVLVLLVLFLLRAARRSLRIDESHHDAQQQNNTLANARQAREGTIPGVLFDSGWRPFGPRRGKRQTTTSSPEEDSDSGSSPKGKGKKGKKGKEKATSSRSLDVEPADSPILVQGGSLRTWHIDLSMEQVQVFLSTDGRPLDTDIELWHGKGSPVKIGVYVKNGKLSPFNTVIATPGKSNTVSIRNIGQLDFPISADVVADNVDKPSAECTSSSMTIQGGAFHEYPFEEDVDRVEVFLRSDGRPLNARVELIQGTDNNKQVVELYTEDGSDRPFFCIFETPGSGNVVRVVNTANVESPLTASVVPHSVSKEIDGDAGLADPRAFSKDAAFSTPGYE